jgi:hypothetical protein
MLNVNKGSVEMEIFIIYLITLGIPAVAIALTLLTKKMVIASVPSVILSILLVVLNIAIGINQLVPLAAIFALIASLLFSFSLNKGKRLSGALKLGAIHLICMASLAFGYLLLPYGIDVMTALRVMVILLIAYLAAYGVFSVFLTDSFIAPVIVFAAVQLITFLGTSFFTNVFTSDYYADANLTRLMLIMPFIYYIGSFIISLITKYLKNKKASF